MLRLSVEKANNLCQEALTRRGLSAEDAAICRGAIMFATLRGLDSHGIVSILPGICNSISVGRIDPTSPIQQIKPLVLKGNGAAGPVIGERTIRLAMDAAATSGGGVAGA